MNSVVKIGFQLMTAFFVWVGLGEIFFSLAPEPIANSTKAALASFSFILAIFIIAGTQIKE